MFADNFFTSEELKAKLSEDGFKYVGTAKIKSLGKEFNAKLESDKDLTNLGQDHTIFE